MFHVSSREEVDGVHARVTAAGHRTHKAPEDAFWGARYAIVEDPDGNSVGITSAVDDSMRRPPPAPPRG
ncbi:MAG TPA: VOC family protein [Polyangiaceae bacterium]|nr:VOC family protein [Polyangiaceae bacterium]